MSESQFEAGRVKFDQHLGPCVGDWYEMNDGCRRRFGRDLGESLQLAADPSGRYISLGADGNATYNGPLLDRIIQKSSLGKPLDHDGAVRLIMCSRRTAVSSKKDDGGKICFQWRAQNGVCRHLHLRSGHAITSLQNKPRRSEASKWEEMVKTTGLIGRQAGQANSPPACGLAGYLNGMRPGSELGRQVAVDFESDADFLECGSCPVHSCLPTLSARLSSELTWRN